MRLSRCYLSAKINVKASLDYCVDIVRKHDHEHYLCALLVPRGARDVAFALRAFNVETSQTAQSALFLLLKAIRRSAHQFGLAISDFSRACDNDISVNIDFDQSKQISGNLLYIIKQMSSPYHKHCIMLERQSQVDEILHNVVANLQIRDMVTDKQTGKMRLQFWRDTIDSIYQNKRAPEHPVAMALAHSIRQRKLSKMWFIKLLNAREANLADQPVQYTKEVEEYGESTHSSLLYMTLESLGVQDVTADHAASHLGKAETIVMLLRAAPYYRSRRRVSIPMDILMRHSASQEDFIRGELTPELKEATFDFASLANTHLLKAQSLRKNIPPRGLSAFLPAVACEKFLAKIRRVDFNLFDPHLTERNSLLPLTLLRKSWMRTY